MALPKIALPTSKYTLPELGKQISIRPMTGQEFEILLVAKESPNSTDHVDAVYEILDAVVSVKDSDFDSRELSPLDFDFLFTQLIITSYAKNNVDVVYKCNAKHEGKQCGNELRLGINLNEDIDFTPTASETNTEYDILQYKLIVGKPKSSAIINSNASPFDLVKSVLVKLLDTAANTEWNFSGNVVDVSEKEKDEFVRSSIPSTVIQQIVTDIRSCSRMQFNGQIKCRKCGTTHKVKLNGFQDFFGFASPATK